MKSQKEQKLYTYTHTHTHTHTQTKRNRNQTVFTPYFRFHDKIIENSIKRFAHFSHLALSFFINKIDHRFFIFYFVFNKKSLSELTKIVFLLKTSQKHYLCKI